MLSSVFLYALASSSISANALSNLSSLEDALDEFASSHGADSDSDSFDTLHFGSLSGSSITHPQDGFALSYYRSTSHSLAILVEKDRCAPNAANGQCWRRHKDCVPGKWSWNKTNDLREYVGCTTEDFHNKGWCGTTWEVETGLQQYRKCHLGYCKTPAKYDLANESWWWIIAQPHVGQQFPSKVANETWSAFAKKFSQVLPEPCAQTSRWQVRKVSKMLTNMFSWKTKTIEHHPRVNTDIYTDTHGTQIAMRAYPKRYCASDLRTRFQGSFLLKILPGLVPRVPENKCVWEIENLLPNTSYHVQVFRVDDGLVAPESPLTPFADFDVRTEPISYAVMNVKRCSVFFFICAWVGVLASVLLAVFAVVYPWWRLDLLGCIPGGPSETFDRYCLFRPKSTGSDLQHDECCFQNKCQKTTSDYSEHDPETDERERDEQTMGGTTGGSLTQSPIVRILVDLGLSLAMLLPKIGPLCIILVWHVCFGYRVRAVRYSKTKWKFFSHSLTLLVNIVVIPLNLWYVQKYWLTYGHIVYTKKVDVFSDKSYGDFTSKLQDFNLVAEWELAGLIPCVILSVFLEALRVERFQIKAEVGVRKQISAKMFATHVKWENKNPRDAIASDLYDGTALKILRQLQKAFPEEFAGIYSDHFPGEEEEEEYDAGIYSDHFKFPEEEEYDAEEAYDADERQDCPCCWKIVYLFVSVCFACVPRVWMCWRHQHNIQWVDWLPPIFGEHGTPVTWTRGPFQQYIPHPAYLYILNVAGVTYRFLRFRDKVMEEHRRNIGQMAAFHAILASARGSDFSPSGTPRDASHETQELLRPRSSSFAYFETEYELIQKKTKQMIKQLKPKTTAKDAESPTLPFNMSNPRSQILWWRLREYVMIDLSDERGVSELFLLITLFLTVNMMLAAFVANVALKHITSVTLVMIIVASCGLVFGLQFLYSSKTINDMAQEESYMLQKYALQEQFQGASRGDKLQSQPLNLEQTQMLLNLAGMIKEQPLPETVLGFKVDDKLITAIISPIFGLLAGSIGSWMYRKLTVQI